MFSMAKRAFIGYGYADAEGEILTVDNSIYARRVKIYGATQELQSVEDFEIISAGKNLANINSLTLNGTQPSNGIVFSGISPANTVFHFVKKEESIVNPTAALFRIVFIDDTFEYVTGRYTQATILIKPVKEIKCLNWGGIVGTIDNIQLELGSTATQYTPFSGMSIITFDVTLADGDYIEINNETKTTTAYIGGVPTPLPYEPLKTYHPFTQIYTTSEITPYLEGKFRTKRGL